MDEYIEMISILVLFMLFTVYIWKNNYWLHGFWLLAIFWFGITTMIETDFVVYPLVCMVFSFILTGFSISQKYKGSD